MFPVVSGSLVFLSLKVKCTILIWLTFNDFTFEGDVSKIRPYNSHIFTFRSNRFVFLRIFQYSANLGEPKNTEAGRIKALLVMVTFNTKVESPR